MKSGNGPGRLLVAGIIVVIGVTVMGHEFKDLYSTVQELFR